MPTLRELQLGFAAALRGEPRSPRHDAPVRAHGLDGARRIQVYRNNSRSALGDALAAVYPVTQQLVGEAFFRQAAQAYVRIHPSRSGDIHRYGEGFAAHIAQFRGARACTYLPDVARLEWSYHEVFHSELSAPLNIASLATVAPADYPRLRFELQCAARLIASDFPVLRIWEVNQPDYTGNALIDLTAGATRLLVRRAGAGVVFQPLGPGEYRFLKAIGEGCELSQAQSRANAVDADFDLALALPQAVALGILCGWCLERRAHPANRSNNDSMYGGRS